MYLMSDFPVALTEGASWMLVFCVVASDEPYPPCIATLTGADCRLDLKAGATFAIFISYRELVFSLVTLGG